MKLTQEQVRNGELLCYAVVLVVFLMWLLDGVMAYVA